MNDSDRDVLRTIIREEVRAAMDEHEANLAVARVRRSAALEELARNDAQIWSVGLNDDGYPVPVSGAHPQVFTRPCGRAHHVICSHQSKSFPYSCACEGAHGYEMPIAGRHV